MMSSTKEKILDSHLHEFNPQGRLEYFKIVKDTRDKGESLEKRRRDIQRELFPENQLGVTQQKLMKIPKYKDFWESEYIAEKQIQRKNFEDGCNKILLDKSLVTQKGKLKLDRRKVFSDRYEMCKYLEPFLDEAGDMIQNWGVLEWTSAFYSSQQLRLNESKDPLVTIAWHICMRDDVTRIDDNEKYGAFSNQNLKRHMIHHHFMYHKRFKNSPVV